MNLFHKNIKSTLRFTTIYGSQEAAGIKTRFAAREGLPILQQRFFLASNDGQQSKGAGYVRDRTGCTK